MTDHGLIPLFIGAVTGGPVNADNKRRALAIVNDALGTRYGITGMNSWIAGRKPAPVRAQNLMRRTILVQRLGSDGEQLADMLEL